MLRLDIIFSFILTFFDTSMVHFNTMALRYEFQVNDSIIKHLNGVKISVHFASFNNIKNDTTAL